MLARLFWNMVHIFSTTLQTENPTKPTKNVLYGKWSILKQSKNKYCTGTALLTSFYNENAHYRYIFKDPTLNFSCWIKKWKVPESSSTLFCTTLRTSFLFPSKPRCNTNSEANNISCLQLARSVKYPQ